MTRIIALDPGTTQTAWAIFADGQPKETGKADNQKILDWLRGTKLDRENDFLAVEGIASYGMAVGKEVFETVMWIGAFREAWTVGGGKCRLVYRKEVKIFLCETSKANDSNIRAALLDRYGPGKEIAIGNKANPGPLYGIKGDEWSALAVAITAANVVIRPEPSQQTSAKAHAEGVPF